MRLPASILLVVAGIAPPAPVRAQSLADLARHEMDRRASIETAGRVFNNANLPVDPRSASPRSLTIDRPPADPLATDEASVSADAPVLGASTFDDRDESYWRGRADALRRRLSLARENVAALSARAAGLSGRSAADRSERELTVGALQTAELDFRALDVDWIGLEKQARLAKIPLNWLR